MSIRMACQSILKGYIPILLFPILLFVSVVFKMKDKLLLRIEKQQKCERIDSVLKMFFAVLTELAGLHLGLLDLAPQESSR